MQPDRLGNTGSQAEDCDQPRQGDCNRAIDPEEVGDAIDLFAVV